jgi:hypothetical protein
MRFQRRMTVAGAMLVLASGCSVVGIDSDLESQLQDQRRAFLAQGLTSYSYEFQRSCFCADVRPVIITVVNDEVRSVVIKETGEAVTQYLDGYMTIRALYSQLIEWADRDPHQMAVHFDAVHHIPSMVSVDFEENTADDELTLTLSNIFFDTVDVI